VTGVTLTGALDDGSAELRWATVVLDQAAVVRRITEELKVPDHRRI